MSPLGLNSVGSAMSEMSALIPQNRVARRALTTQKKRDAGASLYAIERCKLFSCFRFGEFLFELVDPVLQRR